jgi:hypothetical protein
MNGSMPRSLTRFGGFHRASRSAYRWGEQCRACFTRVTAASSSQPRDHGGEGGILT